MSVSPTAVHHRRTPSRALLVAAGVLVLAVLAAVLFASGAFETSSGTPVVGSGVAATEERTVDSFASMDLAGSSRLTVRVGAPQSVLVGADDNLLDRVTTEVDGERLVVATEGSFTATSPMTVTVTLPSLDGLTLSGSGAITAEGVRGAELAVTLSGSGLVRATGQVDTLVVTLTGSGEVELGELEAADVRAELAGSGRIVVYASDVLDASIPGTGTITYLGSPLDVTRDVSGTGAVVSG